jgi:hypothetical protein
LWIKPTSAAEQPIASNAAKHQSMKRTSHLFTYSFATDLTKALFRTLSVLKEHCEIINLLNSACAILYVPRFRFDSRWHTFRKPNVSFLTEMFCEKRNDGSFKSLVHAESYHRKHCTHQGENALIMIAVLGDTVVLVHCGFGDSVRVRNRKRFGIGYVFNLHFTYGQRSL